jgi:ADP-ribosylglycohydrolase
MRELAAGVHWALAGSRGEFSAGNGAAMRIAPLAFLLDTTNVNDRTLVRDVCRITHHHDQAYLGALAVVAAIRSVLAGRATSYAACSRPRNPGETSPQYARNCFPGTTHPLEPNREVPLALHCAQFTAELPLSKVIAQAIEAGGDTDTIASITGQIAGTVSGFDPDCAAHFS